MIRIREVGVNEADEFFALHIDYLIKDGIIDDKEDVEYFLSDEYRGVIKSHMERDADKHHLIYFTENGQRIGASSYCIYESDGGKCFVLDFWVFPKYRGGGTGRRCFKALETYTKNFGAQYYVLNSSKADSVRFWISNGFIENGKDEYGERLFIKDDWKSI